MNSNYHQYCDDFREASEYVFNWINGQPSVGEESITDWLLYNLSLTVPTLKYKKFTKHEEAKKTGADWEWWFVDNYKGLSLRVQAKRIMKDKDNYDGLAHTNRHGLQIEKLIDDARRKNSLPFYSLYHAPDGIPHVLCGGMRDAGQGQVYFLLVQLIFITNILSVVEDELKQRICYHVLTRCIVWYVVKR